MAAFALMLRTSGIAAWVITAIAIFQAFGGRSWWAVAIWGIIALVLSSWGRAATAGARQRESDFVMGGLASIIDSSPHLGAEIDSVRATEGRFASSPVGEVFPAAAAAVGKAVVFLLAWALTVGGPIAMVVGWFFAITGNWWVLSAGVAAVIVASWIWSVHRDGFARHDLAAFATNALPAGMALPPIELRLSLWAVAQGVVNPSIPAHGRAPFITGVYQDLVRAWARDQAAS